MTNALRGGLSFGGIYAPPEDVTPAVPLAMARPVAPEPVPGMAAPVPAQAPRREPPRAASTQGLREGILSTAASLGMDPRDLATIISYETAGTFDPTKRGPTTQWGQHRGLIQFGEPQARQHGVDWNDPLGSQLGPDGAVARYFRASGWRPGMGLLDAYSIVNAGGPGRYDASDASNGGAPGTVRDKVEGQMAGHRANAEQLLGLAHDPAVTLTFGDRGQPPAARRGSFAALAGLLAGGDEAAGSERPRVEFARHEVALPERRVRPAASRNALAGVDAAFDIYRRVRA